MDRVWYITFSFFPITSLENHISKVLFFRFMCHKCGKGFLRKTMFEEHVMRDSCDTSSTNNATPEPVKCTDCDETFSGRRYFFQHYRAIHGGLPPTCEVNIFKPLIFRKFAQILSAHLIHGC